MDRNDLRTRINEIINKSDIENRNIWIDIMDKICEYEEEKFDLLKNRVENQLASESGGWKINFNLADSTYFNQQGETDFPVEINHYGFLLCRYEEINEYLSKTYIGKYTDEKNSEKSFEYSLIPYKTAIDEFEREIFEIADLYKIKTPVIYAPLLRRLMRISTDIDLSDSKNINFCISENNLKNIFYADKRLIWNCKLECRSAYSEEKIVNSSKFRYKFDNIKPDEYIHFSAKNFSDYEILKNENDISVISERIDSNHKFNKYKFFNCVNNEFSYEFDDKEKLPVRIISISDIHDILNRFSFNGRVIVNEDIITDILKIKSQVESGSVVICKYNRNQEYKYCNDFYLSMKDTVSRSIYLIFKNDSEDIFFFDKIVFIINFLRRNYPEFNWEGGYRK